MAKNVFRRSPSFRLSGQNLVKLNAAGASAAIADDFFEYVAPTNATPTRISVSSQGPSQNVTMPSVIYGDLVVVYAIRDGGSASDPNMSIWTTIKNIYQSADGEPFIAAYHVCDGSESGSSAAFSFSLDFYYTVEVWRYADPVTPIGASDSYVSSGIGPSGAVSAIATTLPSVTTTVSNSVVVAAFAGDVTDDADIYTYSTPSGFSGKFQFYQSYNTDCVFNRVKVDAGASGTVTSNINTEARMGIIFVINAVASSVVNMRAIVVISDKWQEVTDAQIGTGLKPFVLYNNNFVERVASEGVPLILSGNALREIQSGETLLI